MAESPFGSFDMLSRGDSVVAGFSGGADSTALLHMLCSIRGGLGLKITAAHINHGLRGEEAQRDEDFVRRVCAQWDVGLEVLHADVRAEAERSGRTVEEAGRKVRYGFFDSVAAPDGAWIATAHTLSDSIETALLNFTRGTGLRGVCGIPARRGRVIRPLLALTRADTERYCREHGLSYVDDSTNFSRQYARNRVRLDVVPVLAAINPGFSQAAGRAMQSFARDDSALSRISSELLEGARENGGYSLAALSQIPDDLIRRVLALAAKEATGLTQEAVHIELLLGAVAAGRGAVQLRGGAVARAQAGRLTFASPETLGLSKKDFSAPFGPGEFDNGAFRLVISIISGEELKNFKIINKQCFNNALDCDRIIGTAVIRARAPGEAYEPAGRGVTKTLKKLLSEAGVPRELRELLPVAADSEGPVWVCGFGPAQRCRVTESTVRAAVIKICAPHGGADRI